MNKNTSIAVLIIGIGVFLFGEFLHTNHIIWMSLDH